MVNKWHQQGNDFFLQETSQQSDTLPLGVYKINENPMTKALYLTRVQDDFSFPYKVYGMETKFINRVVKTYNATAGNLGVLLNGVKGTGKTVTAQMICNELKQPVLIVHHAYAGISSYLNELQQNVIVFFDEYEKMYNDYDATILTVMDGVLNNEYRKTFLLTTNKMYLNDNLLQRPGRLRYIKTFVDLSLEVIMEIIDDKLIHKQFREQCVAFISTLDTITIDIVKAVIEEVNIHEEVPTNFKDVFNIKAIENSVNIFINKENEGLLDLKFANARIYPLKITPECVGDDFEINGIEIGEIKQIIGEDRIVVDVYDNTRVKKMLGKEKEDGGFIETFRFEFIETKHHSFNTKYAM